MIQFLRELDILEPQETGMESRVFRDPSIKAVVFDIYGTLLMSESGDIDLSKMTTESLKVAFEKAGLELVAHSQEEEHQILHHLLRSFALSVKQQHKMAKRNNIPFPEVDVIKVWQQVVQCAMDQHMVQRNGLLHIQCLTFIFEVLSNRVYPMPGMKEILTELPEKNYVTGIVSNAQFYTPIIMNYFTHGVMDGEYIHIVDKDLQIFSYKEGIAKPDTRLYEKLADKLTAKYRIKPEECLFVGNDMYKDIYPAQKCGLKTALFAGDKRSLRLRTEIPDVRNVEPDFIITKLEQINNVVS